MRVVVCLSQVETIFPYDPVTTERADMCVMRWLEAVSRRDTFRRAATNIERPRKGLQVIIRQPLHRKCRRVKT
jgi:hypothetical protein